MANYTVASGHNGVEPWTMVASQVDTVTFADDVKRVDVMSDGTAEVRLVVGGGTPAIGAAGASSSSFRIPAAGGTTVLNIPLGTTTDVVKLISAGTPKVSVQVSP